jgi:hypothetical protein
MEPGCWPDRIHAFEIVPYRLLQLAIHDLVEGSGEGLARELDETADELSGADELTSADELIPIDELASADDDAIMVDDESIEELDTGRGCRPQPDLK